MSNEKRGVRLIAVGGEMKPYRLSAQACEEFKALTGISVFQLDRVLAEAPDDQALFSLMYVGLHAEDRTLTRAQFDEAVSLEELGAFVRDFGQTMQIAFGPRAEGNAPTAPTAT